MPDATFDLEHELNEAVEAAGEAAARALRELEKIKALKAQPRTRSQTPLFEAPLFQMSLKELQLSFRTLPLSTETHFGDPVVFEIRRDRTRIIVPNARWTFWLDLMADNNVEADEVVAFQTAYGTLAGHGALCRQSNHAETFDFRLLPGKNILEITQLTALKGSRIPLKALAIAKSDLPTIHDSTTRISIEPERLRRLFAAASPFVPKVSRNKAHRHVWLTPIQVMAGSDHIVCALEIDPPMHPDLTLAITREDLPWVARALRRMDPENTTLAMDGANCVIADGVFCFAFKPSIETPPVARPIPAERTVLNRIDLVGPYDAQEFAIASNVPIEPESAGVVAMFLRSGFALKFADQRLHGEGFSPLRPADVGVEPEAWDKPDREFQVNAADFRTMFNSMDPDRFSIEVITAAGKTTEFLLASCDHAGYRSRVLLSRFDMTPPVHAKR